MKNSSDTIGNRTRDLPPCSAVPQTTAHRISRETIKAHGILDEKSPEKNMPKSSKGRRRNINHVNPVNKARFKNHCQPNRKQSKRRDRQAGIVKRSNEPHKQAHILRANTHLGALKNQMREVTIGSAISVRLSPSVNWTPIRRARVKTDTVQFK